MDGHAFHAAQSQSCGHIRLNYHLINKIQYTTIDNMTTLTKNIAERYMYKYVHV